MHKAIYATHLSFLIAMCLYTTLCYSQTLDSKPKAIQDTDKFTILYAEPPTNTTPFWKKVLKLNKVVAKQLKINLVAIKPSDIEHNDNSHLMIEDFLKNNKVDGFITGFFSSNEKQLLEILKKYQTPFISINSPLTKEQYQLLGKPREKFPHWLTHISPDDFAAGSRLASILASRIKLGNQAKILALSGDKYGTASLNRTLGLSKSHLRGSANFELVQNIYTDWSKTTSKKLTIKALNKLSKNHSIINKVNLIWAASDHIALGSIEAMESLNLVPGKDILVGGIDWSNDGIKLIESGKMEVSLGGHFIEGALALILLHDYLNGLDFSKQAEPIINTLMIALSQRNMSQIKPKLQEEYWQSIDFTKQSKSLNPKLRHYLTNPKDMLKFY